MILRNLALQLDFVTRESQTLVLSYEYVMFDQLKEIYRANKIASSIFFVRGTEAPILVTTDQERSP